MNETIELIINGKRIPLSEFPKDFIKNTVIGMVTTLKGVDEPIQTVSITISTMEESIKR